MSGTLFGIVEIRMYLKKNFIVMQINYWDIKIML